MKVYEIRLNMYGSQALIVTEPEAVVSELKEDSFEDGEPFDPEDVLLKVNGLQTGDTLNLDWASVECAEMSQEELDTLPEFAGW